MTIVEAARKHLEKQFKSGEYPIGIKDIREQCELDFIAGTEKQRKQLPWISVEERLPECNAEVVIYHEYGFYVGFMYYSMKSNWWRVNEDERTDMIVSEDDFWMPIPSFDEILEANKDVLKRMKEKGEKQ